MWKGCALSRWSTDFKHFHSEDGCGGLISEKRQSLVNYLWKGFRFLLHKAASTDLAFIVFVPGSKETMAGGLEARSIMNELAVLKWGPHHERKTASLIWQHPPIISASTREAGERAPWRLLARSPSHTDVPGSVRDLTQKLKWKSMEEDTRSWTSGLHTHSHTCMHVPTHVHS